MHARRTLIAALAALSLAVPGVAVAGTSAHDALVFRTASGKVRVFDSVTGPLRTLPAGVLSADGETLLTAQVRGSETVVRRLSIRSGAVIARRTIPGAWAFQTAAADGTLVAGGDNGQPLALVAAERARGYRGEFPVRTTRIAVLPATLTGTLRLLKLPGNFGVDDVGPDGRYLYLIQHLGGQHYQVRGYDLRLGKLAEQPVVDKREAGERMEGLPLARTSNATGTYVMTLYRRPSGAMFVHALYATSLVAFCIDLPRTARVDPSDTSSWGVAAAGNNLYLANPVTGFVGVIDYANLKVLRSASLGAQPGSRGALHPLAASPDGTKLYLARPHGLVPIASDSLTASAPLASRAFGSLAVGSDGAKLYATGGGTTETLDLRTGAADGTPAATAGLTLLAAVKPS